MHKIGIAILLLYLLGMLLTFGYAFNRFRERYVVESKKLPPLAVALFSPTERAMVVSIPATVLWPFYWSSVAFERRTPETVE